MPKLSVVIPAYNEEKRLPRTIDRLLSYLPTLNISWEILVVDDGSRDGTVQYVQGVAATHKEVRIISDGKNRGRGGAVKIGVKEAKGEFILETDSDGSVADEAIGRCLDAFEKDPTLDAIFGSRELKESKIMEWQPPMRVFLGYGFIYLARIVFFMWNITDFTLGFKMFRANAARDIFANQFDPNYFAEAEIVFVADKRGYKYIEIPVIWTNDLDSRIKPMRDVFRTLQGMGKVLLRWIAGAYRAKK